MSKLFVVIVVAIAAVILNYSSGFATEDAQDKTKIIIQINKDGAPYANATLNVEMFHNFTGLSSVTLGETTDEHGFYKFVAEPGIWNVTVGCKAFTVTKIPNADNFVSSREYSPYCGYFPLLWDAHPSSPRVERADDLPGIIYGLIITVVE